MHSEARTDLSVLVERRCRQSAAMAIVARVAAFDGGRDYERDDAGRFAPSFGSGEGNQAYQEATSGGGQAVYDNGSGAPLTLTGDSSGTVDVSSGGVTVGTVEDAGGGSVYVTDASGAPLDHDGNVIEALGGPAPSDAAEAMEPAQAIDALAGIASSSGLGTENAGGSDSFGRADDAVEHMRNGADSATYTGGATDITLQPAGFIDREGNTVYDVRDSGDNAVGSVRDHEDGTLTGLDAAGNQIPRADAVDVLDQISEQAIA